jgi:hypothetical protein
VVDDPKSCDLACELYTPAHQEVVGHYLCALTPKWPAIAGIDGLSVDTIELYERNMMTSWHSGSCTGSYR